MKNVLAAKNESEAILSEDSSTLLHAAGTGDAATAV